MPSDGIVSDASMWFPFSGDCVTFQAMARSDGDQFAIAKIDGQFVGYLNLYSNSIVTRTFSFDGLGAGLHVLHVQRHRGELTVDAFRTPGSAPFFTPPSYSGIVRYEENNPAMRYNGWTYSKRPQSWFENTVGQASGSFVVGSATTNDTASLQFNGTWVNIGFRTRSNAGQAEILIDGVSQGIVGLYSVNDDVTSVQFGDLSAGPHTVEVRVVGAPDPPSTQNNVWLDYIDVYDGTAVSDAFQNANLAQGNGRVHFSDYLGTYPAANGIEGDYTAVGVGAPDANVWYSFLGDSFTFYGFSRNSNPQVEIFVDGVLTRRPLAMDYDFSDTPIAFHFTGLPFGPHAVRVSNVSRDAGRWLRSQPAQHQPLCADGRVVRQRAGRQRRALLRQHRHGQRHGGRRHQQRRRRRVGLRLRHADHLGQALRLPCRRRRHRRRRPDPVDRRHRRRAGQPGADRLHRSGQPGRHRPTARSSSTAARTCASTSADGTILWTNVDAQGLRHPGRAGHRQRGRRPRSGDRHQRRQDAGSAGRRRHAALVHYLHGLRRAAAAGRHDRRRPAGHHRRRLRRRRGRHGRPRCASTTSTWARPRWSGRYPSPRPSAPAG